MTAPTASRRRLSGRRRVTLFLVGLLGTWVVLGSAIPGSGSQAAPAQAGTCHDYVVAGSGPAWARLRSTCPVKTDPRITRCAAGVGGSTLLGAIFGDGVGAIPGFFGGALGCGLQFLPN